ncbi:hypothetical protein E6W39_03515 [Kitasatospora acidiphila]|uniref:Uncharacterized protein n=1 Tax=Kitasatospora acidiphila TaxID=2567942 RepID=A0A540VZF7_9ACTN|nr:hypothetical protein [Kitasatospora acidiphila]TQF01484.1 hypothetical protein E6W39_03515 [Kitasatospora acidiphila]
MDPLAVDGLISAAGTTLVNAMATDAWHQVKDSAVALWHCVHPTQEAAVAEELSDVRAELLAAREAGDERLETVLADDWQRKLRRLLNRYPSLVPELQRILDEEWRPLLNEPRPSASHTTVIQRAEASDHSTIVQAAGNVKWSSRDAAS